MSFMKEHRILCTGGSGFIGTHFCDYVISQGSELVNVDVKSPNKIEHIDCWQQCNILDTDKLGEIFKHFQPTHILHLAARCSLTGESIHDFKENTIGTANVIEAVRNTPSVQQVVVTSSQHVRKPGSGIPKHDEDYFPHGLYGESKVITEDFTRNANLNCIWTIIRPTNIWGPWHPSLPDGLWRMMKKGWYIHPKADPIIRNYGFVGNTVWQIAKIFQAPPSQVDGRMFYVGEEPIKQIDWINQFSKALTGKVVRTVPLPFIRLISLVGDVLAILGIHFPMHRSRFFNLTTDNPVSVSPAINAFGVPPFSMNEGIDLTLKWLGEKWNE